MGLENNNITLIGMPGVGKSTVGVLLAKTLGYDFLDSDLLMQNVHAKLLQKLVDEQGFDGFVALEEKAILSIKTDTTVIATGGSVVYSKKAMEHLADISSVIIFLKLPLELLKERLTNIATRGVLMREGQSLEELYAERYDLYERYANLCIHCENLDMEKIIESILEKL